LWSVPPRVVVETVVGDRKEAAVDTKEHENEPRPWGALLLILVYLAILAAFWLNTYLRIWRS
jgi:hypothetical protein